jgi:hypothetical protein
MVAGESKHSGSRVISLKMAKVEEDSEGEAHLVDVLLEDRLKGLQRSLHERCGDVERK